MKIEEGKLLTPSGESYVGFKISIGGITDPAEIKRTYEDIENTLTLNEINFITHEEHSPDGKFKSYSVSTN